MIDQYIKSQKGKAFSWGKMDCFTFCLGWADRKNDTNLLGQYRYASAREAMEIVKAAGCRASWELFDIHFTRVDNPEPGDIVALEIASIDQIGVCGVMTDGGIFSVSNRGVAFVDAPVVAAWRVS